MRYTERNGERISAFSLGTVQLGMKYGLGEHAEKPSEAEAFAILDRAAESGVTVLDTANNYGDSEQVIGRWLKLRREAGLPCPHVVTKIGPCRHGSYDMLRDDVLRQTDGCRKALGVDTLDCLMAHDYEDYAGDRDNMRKVFAEMKADGMYRVSGISAYSRHDYGVIADSGFDTVQIPQNIFDWGQIECGGMQRLADAGMLIYVRSVFLQGLVFLTPEKLDPRMDFCVPYLMKFRAFCAAYEMEPAVLALSFVLSLPGVSSAVLGCDTAAQVEMNCALFDKAKRLTDGQMAELRAAFSNIDPRVINPQCWYNKF